MKPTTPLFPEECNRPSTQTAPAVRGSPEDLRLAETRRVIEDLMPRDFTPGRFKQLCARLRSEGLTGRETDPDAPPATGLNRVLVFREEPIQNNNDGPGLNGQYA